MQALIRRYIKNSDQTGEPAVRAQYGTLAGAAGIALNLLLFIIKLPTGIASGSIAITSDAFNNLSDMGSSIISLIGMRLARRKPDREHPFGHGRSEYIAALMVAVIILLVGFELLRGSAEGFFKRQDTHLSWPLAVLMLISAFVKLYMYIYNKNIGALINSGVMKAAARDSINDVITTIAVGISALIAPHIDFPIDALFGCIVSLIIVYSGYMIARDTIDLLLGGKPNPELVTRITDMVLSKDGIVGLHDMILHDYGPGRIMASVHAEVPDDMDIHVAHERIDEIEQQIRQALGISIVIHMDPLAAGDENTGRTRAQLERAAKAVNQSLTIHDFRMTPGEKRINLIFDLVVPYGWDQQELNDIENELNIRMQTIDPRYFLVIKFDDGYT